MTERERRKRRQEWQRRTAYRRQERMPESGQKEKDLFFFRFYVTVVISGGILLLSLFPTETAERATQRIKEVIAYDMPQEEIRAIGERVTVFFQQNRWALPSVQTKQTENEAP